MFRIEGGGLFLGGPENMTAGITDLVLVDTPAGWRLFTTTRAGGGMMAVSVGDKMALVESRGFSTSTTLPAPGRLTVLTIDGETVVCATGANDDRLTGYGMNTHGEIGGKVEVVGSPAGVVTASVVVETGDGTFVYFARSSGLACARLNADGTMSGAGQTMLGPDTLGGAVALATAEMAAGRYLLALSAGDNALRCYRIGTEGGLSAVCTLDSAGGLGMAAPSDLKVVQVAGETFALVAAAGSSSISVLRLSGQGELSLVDHVIDQLETRFQGVAAVETVSIEGRVFVIAAGGDGGVTVMELMPDGRLLDVAQAVNGAEATIGQISAITARVVDGRIEVFLAGEGAGITRLYIDPGGLAPHQFGTQGADRLTGGGLGDYLDGREGNDRIDGGTGADILRDGAGQDTLTGGAGADVFMLAADGAAELVMDFQVGVDRIDLTGWGRVYALDALNFRSTLTGAVLSFGKEYLTIRSATLTPIPISALSVGDFFGLWHLPHDPVAGQRILGSARPDVMTGGVGDDVLLGSAGADRLVGGEGFDTVDYSASDTALLINLDTPAPSKGMAQGDSFFGIEAVLGGHGNDRIWGNSALNRLAGNGGDDWLAGRKGGDALDGGAGDDRLLGGLGADTLDGGGGQDIANYRYSGRAVSVDLSTGLGSTGDAAGDVLRGIEGVRGSAFGDSLSGSSTDDWLWGGRGRDQLYGGAGEDSLSGKVGADTVDGGGDDDVLTGGGGADVFVYRLDGGDDVITDFSGAEGDQLRLERDLIPAMTPAQLTATYGRAVGRDLVLEFPGGQHLTLLGGALITDLADYVLLI